MKVLSLFDGCGGARQALFNLNIVPEAYIASEIDKYAVKISNKNYSDIINIGDINDINYTLNRKYVPFDLIIGGFPCLDLSIAKKNRQGLSGKYSGLFWKAADLIKCFNPKYFLVENVFSMSKDNRDVISGVLGVEPILINSALLTAQNRKRLYWTNIPNVVQPKDAQIYLKDIIKEGIVDRDKSYCIDASYYKGSNLKQYFTKCRSQILIDKPNKLGIIGKGGQGQRIYGTNGKSVTLSANGGGQGAKTGLYQVFSEEKYSIRKLIPIECERLQGLPDNYTEGVSNTQRYKMLGNGFTIPVISHILSFFLKYSGG